MNLSTPIILTDKTGKSWSFPSTETLIEFIKREIDFWAQLTNLSATNPTASLYIQRHNNFQQLMNQLTNWKSNFEVWDDNSAYQNIITQINSILGTNWVWSNHPFIHKWLELNQTSNNNIADAFFEASANKTSTRHQNGFDFFQGYLIAYEFTNQDKTDINKRRNAEVKSLNKLRDQLVTTHNELIDNVSKFQEV
jgi:IS1 family transposase